MSSYLVGAILKKQNNHTMKTRVADTVKPVYIGHWREPKNVAIISSFPLYVG